MTCHSKTELIFRHTKFFFTVLYRNPIHKVDTPEFENFVQNFKDLYQNEDPYTTLVIGDFNAHSLNWWPKVIAPKKEFNLIISSLMSSCIDLIISDQPNLMLNCC